MKRFFAGLLLSAVVSAPALAAEQGGYIGGMLGQANASGNLAAFSSKATDLSLGVLGGFKFNQNFAGELQLVSLGETTYLGGGSVSASALTVSGVGILPVNNEFSVFGKLGLAFTTLTGSSGLLGEERRTSLTFGFGAQIDIPGNLALRAGYDQYVVGHTGRGIYGYDGIIDVFSAGAIYRF